jgi:protein-tyrosine phosphatase
MLETILMVCVGNVCRSPMAEAVLEGRARALGRAVRVSSAGLAALVGEPAQPLAQELMRERGLDISGHLARQVTPGLLAAFELVLVMDDEQRRGLGRLAPEARGKIRRLGDFGGFDVPDPYLGPRPAYEQALALIDRGVSDLVRHLWREPS